MKLSAISMTKVLLRDMTGEDVLLVDASAEEGHGRVVDRWHCHEISVDVGAGGVTEVHIYLKIINIINI